jgi:hypothetical protein
VSPRAWLRHDRRQDVLKAADAHRPARDRAQALVLEQRHDLTRIDVAMPVEVCEDAPLGLSVCEVNDQETSFGCEHAAHFAYELLSHRTRQVMQHQRAEDDIELRGREGQCFGACSCFGAPTLNNLFES